MLQVDKNKKGIQYQQVLVLNASYEPINICGLKRAIVLVVTGVAKSEEETLSIIRSPSIEIRIPAVIRLVAYVRIPYMRRTLSKKNIFLRDQNTCQYCGKKFDTGNLTLDHVVPKSRGGNSTWENLVTSCKSCNVKKGDKTPKEAGMQLLIIPKPNSLFYLHIARYKGRENKLWRKYLFY